MLSRAIFRRFGWRTGAILLAPAIFLIVYSAYPAEQPLLNPDSSGYLTFIPERSGGYPFFLAALKPLVRGLSDYTIAQRVLYASCVLVLGYELLHYLNSAALAVMAEIVLLFNPEVNRYHFAIFTESLFLSMSALFLAAALAHLRNGGTVALAVASAFAGCLIAIRPTGYAFIPVLAVLLLARRHDTYRQTAGAILAAIVPLLAVMALERAYYAAHHPGPRQSLLPVHLLARSGMIEDADAAATIALPPPESRPLRQALEAALAPVRRLIDEAPNQPARCHLRANYEAFVQYGFAQEERSLATARVGPDALTQIALDRLHHGIGGYLAVGFDHLACLWTLGAADEVEQTAMHAYISAHRPLPFEAHVLGGLRAERLPPYPVLVRLGMLGSAALLAACGFALVVNLALRRKSGALLAAGGLCGLAVHGALVLTALAGLGIPRYVLGLWVPLALGAGLCGLWVAELCASHRLLRGYNGSG